MLLAALAAAASMFPPGFKVDPAMMKASQDVSACSAQGYLPWCTDALYAVAPVSRSDLFQVQRQALAGFTPAVGEKPASWKSYAADVLHGRPWSGFCNDMTFTMLDLLTRRGVGADHMWRAMVIIGDGREPNHMVGIVQIENEYWVVGDTAFPTPEPYRLDRLPYRIAMISSVYDGPLWHKVKALP